MCYILLQAEDAPESSISRPTYVNLQEVTLHSNMDSDPPNNEYAALDLRTRSWEVAREDVIVEKIIGKGAFGQVAKGTAKNLSFRSGTGNVAIKMLKGINQYLFFWLSKMQKRCLKKMSFLDSFKIFGVLYVVRIFPFSEGLHCNTIAIHRARNFGIKQVNKGNISILSSPSS